MFRFTILSMNNKDLRFNQLIKGLYFIYILSVWGQILVYYYIQHIIGIQHTWLLKRSPVIKIKIEFQHLLSKITPTHSTGQCNLPQLLRVRNAKAREGDWVKYDAKNKIK